jgi:neopullulanase
MMKKVVSLAILLIWMAGVKAAVNIERVDPTNWFVGMNDPTLQLMVYGPGIKTADVSTTYPGVAVKEIVRLDSPNYLLVYLDISGAQPGVMKLNFINAGKKKTINYELKSRTMRGTDRKGFNSGDVLYMLMPDRFANGNVKNDDVKGMNTYKCDCTKPSLRHGGDLAGIRQHLDYFNQLGVTALWFTPVLENNSPDDNGQSSYHGYATTDYYKVDPRLGTNDEYRDLVADAHKHDLKVVMDMIFNHCGSFHPWLKDMPSKDWFNEPDYKNNYLQTSYRLTPIVDTYASKIDKKETVDGWFVPSMPDLNQKNPYVIKYLIQNSEWWIETVGIDGIRMDTYPYADYDAMAEWMKTINDEYPNYNVVGETWVTEPAYTATFQKDSKLSEKNSNLKTVMDFSFYDKLSIAKNEETDEGFSGLNRIYNSFVYDYLYPNTENIMAFIENHDTDRFLGNGKDVKMLKQALAMLLTTKRIPQLYYGTEILMNGTKSVTDGNVRKDFPGGFPGDNHNAFVKEGRTPEENDMFNWLSRLLHWRQDNKVISEGTMIQFLPHDGVYVFARQKDGETVLTILNGTTKKISLKLNRYAEVINNATLAVDVTTGRNISLGDSLNLEPRASMVLDY